MLITLLFVPLPPGFENLNTALAISRNRHRVQSCNFKKLKIYVENIKYLTVQPTQSLNSFSSHEKIPSFHEQIPSQEFIRRTLVKAEAIIKLLIFSLDLENSKRLSSQIRSALKTNTIRKSKLVLCC